MLGCWDAEMPGNHSVLAGLASAVFRVLGVFTVFSAVALAALVDLAVLETAFSEVFFPDAALEVPLYLTEDRVDALLVAFC